MEPKRTPRKCPKCGKDMEYVEPCHECGRSFGYWICYNNSKHDDQEFYHEKD